MKDDDDDESDESDEKDDCYGLLSLMAKSYNPNGKSMI